jgi:hypothetical protein
VTDTGNQSSAPRHAQGFTGSLRHASIRTTGDVYVQTIEESVLNAMNSRRLEILADWEPAILNGKGTAINGGSRSMNACARKRFIPAPVAATGWRCFSHAA